jgi:hypothetical protein
MAARRSERERRQPGLPSLNQARHDRKRAIVLGRARIYGGAPQFWMWTFLVLSIFGILYWKFAQGELASLKGGVMAKQRAVLQAIGPEILPFRDRIEDWVIETARTEQPDFVAPAIDLEAIRKGPGVYFRLRRSAATSVRDLRAAANRSLRDGFTSCLFVQREVVTGRECHLSSQCEPGELCNDFMVCARPSQPFNLRLAYRAIRVLEPEWADELHRVTSDLSVRAFEVDLDSVTRYDVPIAVQVVAEARYFTLVLDDEAIEGLGRQRQSPSGDAGAEGEELSETEEERLHRTPHRATVAIWDLRSGDLLARVRAMASGSFVSVGQDRPVAERVRAAQQRQVNSCALALAVKESIVEGKAGARAETPSQGSGPVPDEGVAPSD